ncbi:hypothetical protein [Streptomyces sp. NPDC058548]|uniref:hypothetical protein n=1 Tax=Streptomyces sp. NPDC058548 TaxID=3346545 RepID=UPI00364EAA62
MARASAGPSPGSERFDDEYGTYAPRGSTCHVCARPIEELQPARRGTLPRPAGQPAVAYRHSTACPRP